MSGCRGRRTARWRRAAVAGVLASLLSSVTACDFDGAYDLPLPSGVELGEQPFEVTAEFRDVISLVPKSEVRVDDVAVGQVSDVTRDGWHAEVTLLLQKDVRLPDNAIAEIRQTSLLGEKYVALQRGPTAPQGRLSDGDHITLASTGRNPEVEEVLGALSLLLHGGGIAQLQTISRELNAVMNGRQDRIGVVFRELDTLVSNLDDQREQIFRAMEGLNRLSRTLNAEKRTFTRALDTMGPALRILADQRDQLVRMLEGMSELGRVGTRVINRTSDNTLAALRHLQPILNGLAKAGDALPLSTELLISFPFPDEALEVIHGDFANASGRFNLDIEELYYNFTGGDRLPRLPDVKLPDLPLPGPNGPKLPSRPDRPRLPAPDLPTPDLPTPTVPGARELRRLCEQVTGPLRALPRALRGPCSSPQDLDRRQVRRSLRLVCALPTLPSSPLAIRVCGRQRSGDGGGLLDGLPGGAVGDQGGLLSGGLG
ncbi:MAG TPA: MCE family protein [Nocardioidaceae bacterium]|nr:MCE family protein [Nocardioidaceae bacterium]